MTSMTPDEVQAEFEEVNEGYLEDAPSVVQSGWEEYVWTLYDAQGRIDDATLTTLLSLPFVANRVWSSKGAGT